MKLVQFEIKPILLHQIVVRAGFDVVGWNRTLSKATPVQEAGGSVAKTPTEAVEGADYILSILDSGPVVREV